MAIFVRFEGWCGGEPVVQEGRELEEEPLI